MLLDFFFPTLGSEDILSVEFAVDFFFFPISKNQSSLLSCKKFHLRTQVTSMGLGCVCVVVSLHRDLVLEVWWVKKQKY